MNIFLKSTPYIIAGPCGIEDENQLISITNALESMPVDMIRGGVWKPRSKPGHFEGRGEAALEWIQKAKAITAKPFCIEVANRQQVELALKYEIDACWIGARTTVNPFMVQEIANALKGTQVPVMIKNPINPDIELWSGAVERLQQAGLESIAAIHRGFSSYDANTIYRNKPNWAIPIELKRRYKDLPVFCDVSHICGNRTLLSSVAQRALDLDFDGLMIETHPTPDEALSDARQQITPLQLQELLSGLVIRQVSCDTVQDEIEQIRQVLDTMDAEVVDLLGKRMELVQQLGQIKIDNNIAIFQQDRWREIIDSRTQWGGKNKLDAGFILKLFELIHDKSIKTQFELLNTLKQDKI
jgi:chorismate mutase